MKKLIILLLTVTSTISVMGRTYDFDCEVVSPQKYKGDAFYFVASKSSPAEFYYKKKDESQFHPVPGCSRVDDYTRGFEFYLQSFFATCDELAEVDIETDLTNGKNFDFEGQVEFVSGLLGYNADDILNIKCKMIEK